ncbi:MAG: hypothetical protein ABIH49_02350 [archaeon]
MVRNLEKNKGGSFFYKIGKGALYAGILAGLAGCLDGSSSVSSGQGGNSYPTLNLSGRGGAVPYDVTITLNCTPEEQTQRSEILFEVEGERGRVGSGRNSWQRAYLTLLVAGEWNFEGNCYDPLDNVRTARETVVTTQN